MEARARNSPHAAAARSLEGMVLGFLSRQWISAAELIEVMGADVTGGLQIRNRLHALKDKGEIEYRSVKWLRGTKLEYRRRL